MFVRLTALGDGTEDTRRPARLEELDGLAGAGDGDGGDGEIRAVLDLAAGARLLTLAHEALIRCRPRLHGWLAQDREATRTARRLTDAAQTWEALGREPGALYRGTRLALAAGLDRTTMPVPEREFLDAGLVAQAAEHLAVRRRATLRQLSVLLVLTTTAAALAVRAQRTADRQRDVAGSQRAAERAAALRTVDPAPAAQLSLAAYRLSPTPEARGSVLSTFATSYATELTGTGAVTAVAFSPDGRTLATGSQDWNVLLWDPDLERAAARICATVFPTITRAEWRQYLPQWKYRPPCGS